MTRENRKRACPWVLGFLMLGMLSLAGAAQEYGEGSHHYQIRHGRIERIWQSGGYELATLAMEWSPGGAEAPGARETPMRPQSGMGVLIMINFGTASLRMPIGRVQGVAPDGRACVVRLDGKLLARTVQNPTDQSTHPVREFLVVGAEVAVSAEPF